MRNSRVQIETIKDVPTKTIEKFGEFFQERFLDLENTYKWPIGEKAKSTLENFPWHKWYHKTGSLSECIALKHYLTDKWRLGDASEREEMARWIVADWGGVRANDPLTLKLHLSRALDENSERPLKGVASYSKILSASNCTQNAIYDARVAACLNAIQLKMKFDSPIFFHYVPSRNKIIQDNKTKSGFVHRFSKRDLVGRLGWSEVKEDANYTVYNDMLLKLKSNFPNKEIYHFEMTLFTYALKICEEL